MGYCLMKKLYLQQNEDGYITGWASMGSIENGIEVDCALKDLLDPVLMGCQRYINGTIVTDIERKEAKEAATRADEEIREIEEWFSEYDNQICQYQRAMRLRMTFDKDIEELDCEAEKKQMRIRELLGKTEA